VASAAATLSRRRAGAETRADLICSAGELFRRHGYPGTTFKQVAHRAGVTRSAVNYHFPTKRALYQKVMEASCAAVVAPAVREAVKERTLAQQVSVFIDVTGRAAAQDRPAAAFLCTSAAECATWPDLRDPEHDPIATVRAFLTRAVRAAEQRGELRGTDLGPLVELLVAMLCGIWFYVGFLGTEHGHAITSTIRQLLTGRLPTLTEVPTVSAGIAAGATPTGASSTTTAATSVLARVDGDTWIGQ
jgi:AcrR family transcriptional regulator